MDFNGDGKPDYSSPYQLRRELVIRQFDFNQPIERYKLGRALYHIAQHRGFKSSKGETLSQQETNSKQSLTDEATDVAGEMKASEEKLSKGLSTYMKENNLLTVGAAFAQLEDEGVRVRNNNDYRAIRSQFQREIETIFKFQQGLSVEMSCMNALLVRRKILVQSFINVHYVRNVAMWVNVHLNVQSHVVPLGIHCLRSSVLGH